MWAPQHCSMLFSSGQNRLCVFCCVCNTHTLKTIEMDFSKLVLDIGDHIEAAIDADTNSAQGLARPTEEWITGGKMPKETIVLRTAEDTKNESGVKLRQFNPSFLLKDFETVRWRFPGCPVKSNSSEKVKQDLFLCSTHREELISEVKKRCAEGNVAVPNYKQEDFNGYTSLIAKLEKAFIYFQKQASCATNLLLAKVFLNTRNYLIITSALLNPNGDNQTTALPSCMAILESLLSIINERERAAVVLMQESVRAAVMLMKEIQTMILCFFGICYTWVELTNPGTRLGGGIGLALGMLGPLLYGFDYRVVWFCGVVGLCAGSLIGSGVYDWNSNIDDIERRQKNMKDYLQFLAHQYRIIRVSANASGNITLQR